MTHLSVKGCILSFVSGNWNSVCDFEFDFERSTWAGLHNVVGILFLVSSVLVLVVNALFGRLVMRQWKGDTKFGPHSNYIQSYEKYKTDVAFEFGMAFYWSIGMSHNYES